MILVAVYDSVAGTFGQPVGFRNKNEAARSFDKQMDASPFAADMSLYQVGTYDEEQGIITPCHEYIKHAEVKHNVETE